jgi:hypothetical protein
MKSVKSSILLTSGGLVLAATTLGIGTALFGHNPETMVRLTTVASILGTGSIGLFFVGLAFPKQEVTTLSLDGVSQTVKKDL